jgi:hypothetical protein
MYYSVLTCLIQVKKIDSYLSNEWHSPQFIYLFFTWFERYLECEMITLEAYSWFIGFNISIIRSIYDIKLLIHLFLFDIKLKLFDMRWFI